VSPVVEQEFIEVVQVIEKDEPDVQPAQGEEKGEEEQAKPDTVALAGLHPLFGAFPPVAAIQAVEAAGPDGAAAGGLGHGEGLVSAAALLSSALCSALHCFPAPLRVCLPPPSSSPWLSPTGQTGGTVLWLRMWVSLVLLVSDAEGNKVCVQNELFF